MVLATPCLWISDDYHPIWSGWREWAPPPVRPWHPGFWMRRSGCLLTLHPVPSGRTEEPAAVVWQLRGPAILVSQGWTNHNNLLSPRLGLGTVHFLPCWSSQASARHIEWIPISQIRKLRVRQDHRSQVKLVSRSETRSCSPGVQCSSTLGTFAASTYHLTRSCLTICKRRTSAYHEEKPCPSKRRLKETLSWFSGRRRCSCWTLS